MTTTSHIHIRNFSNESYNSAYVCRICGLQMCWGISPDGSLFCTVLTDHVGFHVNHWLGESWPREEDRAERKAQP